MRFAVPSCLPVALVADAGGEARLAGSLAGKIS
jgi:hypothetical protein